MCVWGTKQRYVLFSVCFKTALFNYVIVIWSGFLSAKLNLFCSWHLCAADKQLQRILCLHSNCLKYLGKTVPFSIR